MDDTCVSRRLVVIGVDDYGNADESFTKAITAQVAVVTGWLSSSALDSERRFTLSRPKQLRRTADLRSFLSEEFTEVFYDEALVVYITGHGARSSSGRHYLTFLHTDDERLLSTAFPTGEFIAALMDSQAEHILIMVDSCFAGSLDSELRSRLQDLSPERRRSRSIAVVTSGDFDDEPLIGNFTRLVSLSLEKMKDEAAGYTRSHLSFEEWEKLLNSVGEENPGLVRAEWVWPRSRHRVESECLPNPGYRPPQTVVSSARSQLALSAPVLDSYWLSRASGRADDNDAGWYFSGRGELMRSVVKFVRDGQGALVVTGAAGSGKSALLARLVTLSDPGFLAADRFRDIAESVPEDLMPPAGSVDAAVLARGKTSLVVVEELLEAFGEPTSGEGTPPLQVLLNLLEERSFDNKLPVTLVLDGIDEAQQPLEFISDVVGPMARLENALGNRSVRLVLGIRSSAHDGSAKLRDPDADRLLARLESSLGGDGVDEPVPLDMLRTDGQLTEQDIRAYALAMLLEDESSPYHRAEDTAAETAEAVAHAVQPSFLDARLAADQLRKGDAPQDLHDEAWRARLAAGTTALLREDIQHVARDSDVSDVLLLAALRATAFAPGSGLPWAEVWPVVAGAVLEAEAGHLEEIEHAIRTVHSSRLTGYLTAGEEDGRATYRPVHQRVAEALLDAPQSLLADAGPGTSRTTQLVMLRSSLRRPQAVHRSITEACAELVRLAGRFPVHPYVRRHMVAHAAAGKVLDDDHVPHRLLAQETSGTLRARLRLPLPVADLHRRRLTAAALIEPFVDETVDAPSRASSIAFQLAALDEGLQINNGLPFTEAETGTVPSLLEARNVRWEPRRNVVAHPLTMPRALCGFGTLDGRSLIAAATQDGTGVWDSATGQQITRIDSGDTRSLTTLRGNSGRIFLASVNSHGAAVWDPLSGRQVAALDLQNARAVKVLSDSHNRWKVVVLAGSHAVLWKPTEGAAERVRYPFPVSRMLDRDMPVVHCVEGRSLLVFPSQYHICLWDPTDSDFQAVELTDRRRAGVRSLAVVAGPDGQSRVAVAYGFGHPISIWDPHTLRRVGELTGPSQRLTAIPGPGRNGRTCLGAWHSSSLTVWDLTGDSPESVVSLPADRIHAVAGVPAGNEPWKAATAGWEGIRLFERHPKPAGGRKRRTVPAASRASAATHRPARPGLMTVLGSDTNQEVLAIAGGGIVVLIDPSLEFLVQRSFKLRQVHAVQAVPGIPGGLHFAAANPNGISVWNVQERDPVATVETKNPIWCTAALPEGNAALIFSQGSRRGPLRMRDLASGQEQQLTPDSAEEVTALCPLPAFSGDHELAVATSRGVIQIWDLARGYQVNEFPVPPRVRITQMCLLPARRRRYLLAASSPHEITLWDSHGELHDRIDTSLTRTMTPVLIGRGRALLAFGNGAGAHLWDPVTGRMIHSLLTAAPVSNLAHTQAGTAPLLHIGGAAGVATLALTPELATL